MSLKKIAEMVGTSPSTVSRVLNNSYSTCASEQLKEKIWAAAHEINYLPNQAARKLKLGETPRKEALHIVIVLARVESLERDPFFRELYRYLEVDIFQKGFSVERIINANESLNQSDFGRCDGIIVLGRCTKKLLETLLRHTRNVVGIWRNPMNFEIDEVVCDGRKAADLAVSYLIAKGHRKIGYIGDCSYESRYVGYNETLIRNQLPLDYSCIIPTGQTEEEGFAAMEKLLENEEMTAVLCANDSTAFGALRALRSQKRLGQRKISVISIDDVEDAQATRPLLTTVHIPREDMAHMALQILQDRIQNGHREKLRVEFPGRIVERESCFGNGS